MMIKMMAESRKCFHKETRKLKYKTFNITVNDFFSFEVLYALKSGKVKTELSASESPNIFMLMLFFLCFIIE